MINVTVIEGAQGCGKTTYMRTQALRNRGLFLFSHPTIELIKEQVAWLRKRAPHIKVYEAHNESKGRMNVADKLTHCRHTVNEQQDRHVFVFATHETMMNYDFVQWSGWHLRIDEAPISIQSGKINAKISKPFIDSMLTKQQSGGDWSLYTTQNPFSWKDTSQDSMAKNSEEFFKQAKRATGVYINEVARQKSSEYLWFSVWSPSYMRAFSSIQISATSYFKSLGYRAVQEFHGSDVTFIAHPIQTQRTGQPDIEIFYFTDTHSGSTGIWDESEGRKCIVEVTDYLAVHLNDESYWSANEVAGDLMEHRVKGDYISPKAMGLNKFRDKTSCAFIYSSKATPNDAALKLALKLSNDDIRAARESEDIRQFVLRGAIRNLDYAGPYKIYLYEKDQAKTLAEHLTSSGYTNVRVAAVSLPFVSQFKRENKRKSKYTAAEAAERKKAQSKKANEKRTAKRQAKKLASRTDGQQLAGVSNP